MKRNTRVVWILCVCLWALSCLGCARNGNALAQYAPDEADRLTVYTSHKQEVYEPIITEFENRTGIWVTVETGGTSELLERIASETGSPVCDIMFGGGVDSLESYKGYFSPYQSPEEAGIDPAFLSEDHMWAPFSILPTVIIYNQKLVPAHTVTGWRDLIDPRWKGKIAFADPSASGSSYTALATLCQIIPKDTESVLRQFAKNLGGSQFGGSGDVVKAVADGTCFLGITLEET
ncbi:MAG: extracellular solute-binding protein, partial [Christensenellales bacterium]